MNRDGIDGPWLIRRKESRTLQTEESAHEKAQRQEGAWPSEDLVEGAGLSAGSLSKGLAACRQAAQ